MKVMIVDDEQPYRHILRMALEKRGGYEVIEAGSGKECLEMLKTARPDLILLDIMMPGMDGWEVCRRIKEGKATKDIKVVMLSVRKKKPDLTKSVLYSHAETQVEKSAGFNTIIETVDKLLGRKS